MNDPAPNIWQLQARNDIPGLIAALDHDDPLIRRRAAAALHILGAVAGITALEKRLDVEQEPEVRAALANTLEYLLAEQGPVRRSATRRLVEQLKSSDPTQIIQAANELAELKDRTAVEALVIAFHNQRLAANARLAAAEALVALESAPALVTLLVALRSPEWTIRRNAAAVLGQLRADWAVEPLIHRLEDENEIVRRTARAALKRIATPQALKALEIAGSDGGLARTKVQTSRLPATRPLQARQTESAPDAPDAEKPTSQVD